MGPQRKETLRRKRLAEAAAESAKCAEIRLEGGSCGNCKHCGRAPSETRPICKVRSDFYGYRCVDNNYVCSWWESADEGKTAMKIRAEERAKEPRT